MSSDPGITYHDWLVLRARRSVEQHNHIILPLFQEIQKCGWDAAQLERGLRWDILSETESDYTPITEGAQP